MQQYHKLPTITGDQLITLLVKDGWEACGRKTHGIEVGIKSFNVDSDEHREFSPAYFRHAEKQLRVRQPENLYWVTVTAQDNVGNTAIGYSGTVQFTTATKSSVNGVIIGVIIGVVIIIAIALIIWMVMRSAACYLNPLCKKSLSPVGSVSF